MKNYFWNHEYIIQNKLSDEILSNAGITKCRDSEIFVEHPAHKGYYISQYGRAISLRGKKARLLEACAGGRFDFRYLYYKFDRTISVNRAVADVFCPNFWPDSHLEAHHLDGDRFNNHYRNLVLLPTALHKAIHKIKEIVLLEDGEIKPYTNPLDLVWDTGIKLDDILMADKGKSRPLRSRGRYTVYKIRGFLIGFRYYKN